MTYARFPIRGAALLGIPKEGELKKVFRDLRILRYEEVDELSDRQVGPGGRRSSPSAVRLRPQADQQTKALLPDAVLRDCRTMVEV